MNANIVMDEQGAKAKVAIIVQGLFEKSDSIGYDAVSQYNAIRRLSRTPSDVRIFAETVGSDRYLDLAIENIDRLKEWVRINPDAILIYHWCDGWPVFADWLMEANVRIIVRWHNNTPPWFFGRYSLMPVRHTIRGYRGIIALSERRSIEFWPNSEYSERQLSFLKIEPERMHVVYPASKYLEEREPDTFVADVARAADRPVQILFVGRLTPHKGHKHLIAVAGILKRALGRPVKLLLPGRPDGSMPKYLADLKRLAAELDVGVDFPGEIGHDALTALYREADVFLCLSEHEGFGLPVFEAMRMGLPVVGIRTTAFRELLAGHPLAVDALDYKALTATVISALDPDVRQFVVKWQRQYLSDAYSASIVDTQILNGLNGIRQTKAPVVPCGSALDDRIGSTAEEWASKLGQIVDEMPALRQIPLDEVSRLVTLHDIETYESLLSGNRFGSFLFEEVMSSRFPSTRPVLGPVLQLIRRAVLSAQSGLVTGLSLLDAKNQRRSEVLELGMAELRSAIEGLRRSQEEMNSRLKSDAASNSQPRLQQQPGTPGPGTTITPAESVTEDAVRSGTDFGSTSELYQKSYFEGDNQYSNYSSYTRDAVGPSRHLAKTLFELFAPASALEAGCAVGFAVKALRDLGVSAYGYDISEWAVEQAAVPFVARFDFSAEPIVQKYDLVFCYDVVEHITPERLEFALKNLWNATARWLVVIPALYPEGTTSDPNEATHLIFHDRSWWASFMQDRCGITLDDVATMQLDQSEHSRIFGYSGRVFVAARR